MFRFTLAMVTCLVFAAPGHAFFTELLQTAETLLAAHESDIKELDKKLIDFKNRIKETLEKISNSGLLTPKLKQSLVDGLSILEEEFTQKIEEAKKTLQKPSTSPTTDL